MRCTMIAAAFMASALVVPFNGPPGDGDHHGYENHGFGVDHHGGSGHVGGGDHWGGGNPWDGESSQDEQHSYDADCDVAWVTADDLARASSLASEMDPIDVESSTSPRYPTYTHPGCYWPECTISDRIFPTTTDLVIETAFTTTTTSVEAQVSAAPVESSAPLGVSSALPLFTVPPPVFDPPIVQPSASPNAPPVSTATSAGPTAAAGWPRFPYPSGVTTVATTASTGSETNTYTYKPPMHTLWRDAGHSLNSEQLTTCK